MERSDNGHVCMITNVLVGARVTHQSCIQKTLGWKLSHINGYTNIFLLTFLSPSRPIL
jgi:hypothetical protein